jgi:acyl-CoA reductase-like NAD-dependent aldehyde dehydrogenase
MKTYQHFIDGKYVDPLKGRWFDSVDPYKGEPWARIPQGCEQDVDRAVQAASRALRVGPWAAMTATERGKLMLRLADLVTKNAERLAELEVRDNGKLMAEMRGQMNYHPEWWRYFGGLADKIEGRVMPIDKPNMLAFSTQEPVGVVGALTAWNSPLLFIAWKCAPAIAAGCTVVIKPSEFTSASTLEYAALTSTDPADLARQMTERSAQGWEILQIVTSGTAITAFARRAAVTAQIATPAAAAPAATASATSATWSSTAATSASTPVVTSAVNTSVASSVGDAAAPANWYPDPAGRFELRYWNGSAWTEHVSRNGQQSIDPPVA